MVYNITGPKLIYLKSSIPILKYELKSTKVLSPLIHFYLGSSQNVIA